MSRWDSTNLDFQNLETTKQTTSKNKQQTNKKTISERHTRTL